MRLVHQEQLIHRDIKPANILLQVKGSLNTPVLCDFGIAKVPGGVGTSTGVGLGSKYYISPEQDESAKYVNASSDVYSVGILAYRMFTGTMPLLTQYKDPKALVPALSEALNTLILEAVAAEPNQRPQNAGEFLARLQQTPEVQEGANEPTEEPGTQIGGNDQTDVRDELKPLYEKIKAAWLNDGEIDSKEKELFVAMAVVVDLSNDELDKLIQRVYDDHNKQIKPLKNFMALVAQKVDEQITKTNRELEAYTQQTLNTAAKAIGWDDATFDAMLSVKIADYAKAKGWKPLKQKQKQTQQAQPKSTDSTGNDTGEDKGKNKIAIVLLILVSLIGGVWLLGTDKSPEPGEQTKAKINTPSQEPTQSQADKQAKALKKAQQEKEALENRLALEQQKAREAQAALDASKPKLYALTIQPEPSNATVKILNIKPPYEDGIELEAGDYHISVSAPGYETTTEWLTLTNRDLSKRIRLSKEAPKSVPLDDLGIKLVTIPAGSFMMGSKEETDEQPIHKVSIESFKMMAHEVTVGQFKAFVQATGYKTDAENNVGGASGCQTLEDGEFAYRSGRSWRKPGFDQTDKQPVVCVSYRDAQQFIEWLSDQTKQSFRLPSEAEWEYAARAGSKTKYSFGNNGDDLCDYGNVADLTKSPTGLPWIGSAKCNDGYWFTAPVGRYKANAYGLYDMHGNVWEWTQDCWNGSYQGSPTIGEAWTQGDCDRRALRGGSWGSGPGGVRAADRLRVDAAVRNCDLGFRLVQGR